MKNGMMALWNVGIMGKRNKTPFTPLSFRPECRNLLSSNCHPELDSGSSV